MTAKWLKAGSVAFPLIIVAACSRSTAPTAPSTRPLPTPGLRIVGPDTMWSGERAQFALVETRADGSSSDVTHAAIWSQSKPSPGLYVFGEGEVLASLGGGITGGGAVLADYGGTQVAHPVAITTTPPGTYQLSGMITSSGYAVPDVRVEIVSGSYATRHAVAVTNAGGGFSLYASGDFDVRATKDGYVTRTDHVSLTGNRTFNISLDPKSPPVDATGSYTLTLAASGCDASFPANLRTRTYTASIAPFGVVPNRIELTLGGAAFGVPETFESAATPGNRLIGLTEPGALSFPLNQAIDERTVVNTVDEVIDADTRLSFRGVTLTATASGDGFGGTLYQGIHLWRWPGLYSEIAGCRSAEITLTGVR